MKIGTAIFLASITALTFAWLLSPDARFVGCVAYGVVIERREQIGVNTDCYLDYLIVRLRMEQSALEQERARREAFDHDPNRW